MEIKKIKQIGWFYHYMTLIEELWLGKIFRKKENERYGVINVIKWIYFITLVIVTFLVASSSAIAFLMLVAGYKLIGVGLIFFTVILIPIVAFMFYAHNYCEDRLI